MRTIGVVGEFSESLLGLPGVVLGGLQGTGDPKGVPGVPGVPLGGPCGVPGA